MENIDRVLQKFINSSDGEFIVTDTLWKILFKSGVIDIDTEKWERWVRLYKDDPTDGLDMDWEIADKDSGTYYKAYTKEVSVEDSRYLVHHVIDVSDYAEIFQDLSAYSRGWRTLSECQKGLIRRISGKVADCLYVLINNLKVPSAVLFAERVNYNTNYLLRRGETKASRNVLRRDLLQQLCEAGKRCSIPGLEGRFMCSAKGTTVTSENYGLYVELEDKADVSMYPMYFSIFKLYIENTLLREMVVYQSEHDSLTGIYNKGKFTDLSQTVFPNCRNITVFNMDVNYLKRTNDTLGHAAGNTLLIKAADSLKAVSDDDIYAFRLGGDEFMLVACDTDEEQAEQIRQRWREKLDELNREDPSVECVIACGMKTGTAPYDFAGLLDEADRLMYADKRAIKIARGDDPDAR
ncbi:MAG: diguanylate cyclase [Clostridiales bacterium]|nr:diguanylate cyclase [Clostridiales bacterium]